MAKNHAEGRKQWPTTCSSQSAKEVTNAIALCNLTDQFTGDTTPTPTSFGGVCGQGTDILAVVLRVLRIAKMVNAPIPLHASLWLKAGIKANSTAFNFLQYQLPGFADMCLDEQVYHLMKRFYDTRSCSILYTRQKERLLDSHSFTLHIFPRAKPTDETGSSEVIYASIRTGWRLAKTMSRHPVATRQRGHSQDSPPRKGETPCINTVSFKPKPKRNRTASGSTTSNQEGSESELYRITVSDRVVEPALGSPHHIMLSTHQPLFRVKYGKTHGSCLNELYEHSMHPAFGSWIRVVHAPASSIAPQLGFYLVVGCKVEKAGDSRRSKLIVTTDWTEPPLPHGVDVKRQWKMLVPYTTRASWHFAQPSGYPTRDNRPWRIEGAVERALSSKWRDLKDSHPFGPAPTETPIADVREELDRRRFTATAGPAEDPPTPSSSSSSEQATEEPDRHEIASASSGSPTHGSNSPRCLPHCSTHTNRPQDHRLKVSCRESGVKTRRTRFPAPNFSMS